MNVTPLLIENLLFIGRIIPVEKWIPNRRGLAVYNDSGFQAHELSFSAPQVGHCRYVQLAMRFAKSTGKTIEKIEVHYDVDLVDRMKELLPQNEFKLQMAILALHEWIYTLAKELGSRESSGVRGLNAFLLSRNTSLAVQNPEAKENLYAELASLDLSSYSTVLGQLYNQLLPRIEHLKGGPPKLLMYETWNRYKAKIEKAEEVRIGDFISRRGGNLTAADDEKLIFLVQNIWLPEFMIKRQQTDAETFMHLAGPLTHQGVIPNPEVFVAMSIDHRAHFRASCRSLRKDLDYWKNAPTDFNIDLREYSGEAQVVKGRYFNGLKISLLSKAIRFCDKWERPD